MTKQKISKQSADKIQDDPGFIEACRQYIAELDASKKQEDEKWEQEAKQRRQEVEKWEQKQKLIPIRVTKKIELPQTIQRNMSGEVVFMVNAPDLANHIKCFEKGIRDRSIRYVTERHPSKSDVQDWNDMAVFALYHDFEKLLEEMDFLIKAGDPKAAAALGLLARETTRRLISISDSHGSVLKVVAERSENWPVLQGRKTHLNQGQKYIKNFDVGKALPFSKEMLAMIPKEPYKEVMRMAFELLNRLEDWRGRDGNTMHWSSPNVAFTKAEANAHKLQAFSLDTWTKWFDHAWDIVMEENNGHPETNEDLKLMGKHRENHTQLTSQPKPDKIFKSPSSNMRDGIKKRLRMAVEKIAKH